MRTWILYNLLLSPALATAVPREEKMIGYAGFKILRLTLPESSVDTAARIEQLAAHVLNPGKATHLDVVVSPEAIDTVPALAVESIVITEDVGTALAEEGGLVTNAELSVAAVPSATWFTAYHLQGSFTERSEIFTAESSVQERALTGIHIWGSGGKGSKPAVLIHGTVHAREWISTMTTIGVDMLLTSE